MSLSGKFNLSDPFQRQQVLAAVHAMKGWVRFQICQFRERRSDRQNRWYWPCFVQPFADWLAEQNGTMAADWEQKAHQIFKDTFLRFPVANADGEQLFKPNGDPVMHTRSTTELTTLEFNVYLDNCGKLLLDLCRHEVPEPNIYHERDAA